MLYKITLRNVRLKCYNIKILFQLLKLKVNLSVHTYIRRAYSVAEVFVSAIGLRFFVLDMVWLKL